MNPARFSVRQPLLVNLGAVVLLGAGAMVLHDMSRETYPTVSTGWARITTVFPGASPEEVERLVTVPIEDAVADLNGVERVVSFSSEGLSYIGVELESSVENVSAAVADVANEVSTLRGLPVQAEAPVVREQLVRVPTLTVAIRGNVPEPVLQSAARYLERRLLRVDGITEVEPAGLAQRQLEVDVDLARSHHVGLSLPEVARHVSARAQNLAAGTTDDGERQRLVRGVLETDTAERLADVIVRPRSDGGAVKLGHVADIRDGYDQGGIVARVEGQKAVILNLHRGPGSDAVRVNQAVRATVADLSDALPGDVSVSIFADASHEVERTTRALYENALLGVILVFLVLGLFMGGRNAAMAALGLPVALAASFVVMELMDVTINMLSLGALILCVGLVVDDAVVIIENIYRHIERGTPRLEAAIEGTREVMWPVISATATTCAAFLPLLLMTGVLGEFFSIIPKVVVAVLVASLVEALFILPGHMAELGGRGTPSTSLAAFGRSLVSGYQRFLRGCLRFRKTTIALWYLVFGALIATAFMTKDVVLLADDDIQGFEVRIRMPADSSVHATDRVLEEVERRLMALRTSDVEAIWTTRGLSSGELRPIEEDYVAMAVVSMVPVEKRSHGGAGRDLLERASKAFDDLVGPEQIQVVEHDLGPPVGAPISVRIAGDDPERLAAIADQVGREIRHIPGARDVESSAAGRKRELRVEVDEPRASLHGLTAADVGRWLRLAFSKAPAATALVDNEPVDIVLSLASNASGPDEMRELSLLTPGGTDVTLGDIATVEEVWRPTHIRRNDRRRGVRVTARLTRGTTSQAANRELVQRLEPLRRANPDVAISLAGEHEETRESIRSLVLAFVLAIGLIYSILAAQFRSLLQPFVIVSAIPLSLIGVSIGFFVSGAPVGLIALVGVVGLAGIVVNDSLVLVDFINTRRADGAPLDEAILDACTVRVRPVVVTSVTTIAGLLPLAFSGDEAPLLAPMATAIAWGLLTATLLTLVVVPCMYRVSCSLGETAEQRLGALWRRVTGAEAEGPRPAA